MAEIVIFNVPDRLIGKQLLEYIEIRAVDEWEIVSRNGMNSFSGSFTILNIFEKKTDLQSEKILIAQLDTRYPGVIYIPKKNEETIKKFREILKEYRDQVLILNNWL